jgi:acylphosphatase
MRRTVAVFVVTSLLLSLAGGFAFARDDRGRDRTPPGQARRQTARERTEFQDAGEAEWADKHIRKLALKGVFQGFEDGTFRPNGPVRRVELIVLAVRMLGLEDEAKARMDERLDYADWASVPRWAAGYVVVAHEQGLLRDLLREGGQTLQVNAPATRLAVVATMVRLMGLAEAAREFPGGDLHFRDLEAIPAWARGFVALAIEEGILRGYDDRTFRPNQPVRRSEMAALLDRVEEWLDDRDDDDEDEDDEDDEDEDREFQGTIVTVVTGPEPRITVANRRHPNGRTFQVDEGAIIFLNGRRAKLDQLQPGDEVELILDDEEDDLVIFISAEFATREVDGRLETVADGKLTLLVEGKSHTFPLDPAVKVFDEQGKLRDLAYLKAGQQVEVTLVRGAVTKVEVEKADQEANLTGTVERVADGAIVLQVAGASRTFPLDAAVKIFDERGTRRDLTYVRAGMQVEITVVGGAVVEIRVKKITIIGIVERVADTTLTLQVGGTSQSFPLSPTVKVTDEQDDRRDLAYIRAGMQVEITLIGGSVVEIEAKEMEITGTVERVADGAIVLQVAGASRTFQLDPAVKTFDERGTRRDLTYVRAGQQVEITLVGGAVVEIRVK